MSSTWLPPNPREIETFWGPLCDRLRSIVGRAHFDTWLGRLRVLGSSPDGLFLFARNAFSKDWIERHYLDSFLAVCEDCGASGKRVHLLLPGEAEEGEGPLLAACGRADGAAGAPPRPAQETRVLSSPREGLPEGKAAEAPWVMGIRGKRGDGLRGGERVASGGQRKPAAGVPFWLESSTPGTEAPGDGDGRARAPGVSAGGERRLFRPAAIPVEASGEAEPEIPLPGSPGGAGRSFPAGGRRGSSGGGPGAREAGSFRAGEGASPENEGGGAPPLEDSGEGPRVEDRGRGPRGVAEDFSGDGPEVFPVLRGGGGDPGALSAGPDLNSASLEFFHKHSDFVLNNNFTFQHFVVGSCNELACAAAKAVAEFPGGPYNPLFIHGGPGLGKTHLLQAICHAILRSPTPRRILYLSCENFVNRFIQAVTDSKLVEFRYACRRVDILLIDDIQFLEGKNRTQEEFFHTFNTLYNGQKQIVLSSDRPPKEIATLKDRLVSRFGWGMVTKLDSPCLETRVAIVKRKSRLRGFEVSDEVAQFMAERIDTNVRELEGAITKVLGFANIMKRRVDLALVEEALADFLPKRREVSIQRVMELVAKEFGIQTRDLQSRTRVKTIVLPRQIAMFLSRKHTGLSLVQVGGFFGGRDHATVMHSIKRVKRILEEEGDLTDRIHDLSNRLLRGE